ncbi:MAG: hypothetical protein JSS61_05325 [Verrucomicrobia bacterium]|nr:hypothetical protein [Verrucomicrobiota bacterium]
MRVWKRNIGLAAVGAAGALGVYGFYWIHTRSKESAKSTSMDLSFRISEVGSAFFKRDQIQDPLTRAHHVETVAQLASTFPVKMRDPKNLHLFFKTHPDWKKPLFCVASLFFERPYRPFIPVGDVQKGVPSLVRNQILNCEYVRCPSGVLIVGKKKAQNCEMFEAALLRDRALVTVGTKEASDISALDPTGKEIGNLSELDQKHQERIRQGNFKVCYSKIVVGTTDPCVCERLFVNKSFAR